MRALPTTATFTLQDKLDGTGEKELQARFNGVVGRKEKLVLTLDPEFLVEEVLEDVPYQIEPTARLGWRKGFFVVQVRVGDVVPKVPRPRVWTPVSADLDPFEPTESVDRTPYVVPLDSKPSRRIRFPPSTLRRDREASLEGRDD